VAGNQPFYRPLLDSWLGFVALGALAYFLAECVLGPEAYERFQERPQRIAVAGGSHPNALAGDCAPTSPRRPGNGDPAPASRRAAASD
jgi:hypothetical protein